MPLLLLLLLFLLYLQDVWPPPAFDWSTGEAILATIAAQGLCVLVAAAIAWQARRSLHRTPFARSEVLRRFARSRLRHFILATGILLVSLYWLGWGWAVKFELLGMWSPLVKPAILGPYLLGLILAWVFFYDADRAAHDSLWRSEERPYLTRAEYLGLQVRHNLLLLIPPLLLMMIQEVLQSLFPALEDPEHFPVVNLVVMIGLLALSILLMPLILRAFLGLKPLPAGELRDRLCATAERLRFRFSDVLVWNTSGTQANAMVTGMVPFFRYVVLTDRLARELSPEEIEAVFGHEIGHIKHHHMTFYTTFLLLSLAVLGAFFEWGTGWLEGHLGDWLAPIVANQEWYLGLIVVYMFVIFGYLSRRCERQADLFGCRVASRAAFIHALEKVADLNGISRDRPGWFSAWQHGTIAQRIDFLRKLDDEPNLEPRFQRRLGVLKWAVTLTLVGLTVALLQTHQWGWLRYL